MRGQSNIQDILAKVRGEELPVKSTVYSPSDIQAAKNVLDRLLRASEGNEVSYITTAPIEIEEV